MTIRAVLVILTLFYYWQNFTIKTRRYVYSNAPSGLKGFRIAQISDYHNNSALETKIVQKVSFENPDIICITGDLFDCRRTDIDAGLSLAKRLSQIAPVYFVTGNHEAKIENIDSILNTLSHCATVLADDSKTIDVNGGKMTIAGLTDPRFFAPDWESEIDRNNFAHRIKSVVKSGDFTVLLSHRPDYLQEYSKTDANLVLTGHAHGGQFGIPFTDIGVFMPNQGLFPKYARGMKKQGNTTEIISRGLGNSKFPFRIFNYPEIVTVEFE